MKKFLLIAVVAMISMTAAIVADIYESLDISREQAKQRLLESITEGYIVAGDQSDLVSKAKNLPVEMRVAGIRQLIRLAKDYTASEEFKKDYQKYRKNKLNPGKKTKLGLPRIGKMIDNAVDNAIEGKENESRYPSDPQLLIKKRLEEFLKISATVDFAANLNGSRFEKSEYEAKNDQWKMCFRAGREVVTAAREDATKWLDEIK